MSILIKGMTRPKNCFECHLTKWIDGGCAGCLADDKIHNASRPIDCPLVEISELQERRKAPEIIRCKDCKHWKDSDGVYRRGISAESKCPVNSRQVYEGTFFCGMAEKRTE